MLRWTTAALAALLLWASGARAEPLKIRVAWITVPTSLAPILFVKPELARHLGKTYTVEPLHFQGSSAMTTALASGDLDIAELSYSSFAYAIQNGGMDDLRIIADEIQDGSHGYTSVEYRALKDGPVKKVEDLKGKVVATNVIGTGTDIGLRAMLRRHGLEDKRDYTVIEASYANMPALLEDHKADLVTSIAFFTEPNQKFRDESRTLFRLSDIQGVTQILSLVARQPFLAKNHAALVDYMEDYLRSLRWYIDPANHAEVVKIVAGFTKQPPQRFESWLLTRKDQYHDPNGLPNLEAMQHNIDVQKKMGFLKADVQVKKYAALGIVKEAAARLNRAQAQAK
ncbi:MAG TPA: ABC transporter substrate-binding protein [Stellaceae bacterium]|nr:ABC transporter substrate-binding protein [Stellaceae bacterium]